MSKLVGYGNGFWTGGAFESEKETPEEAAAEQYTQDNLKGFPGDLNSINVAFVSDFAARKGWKLRKIGDPTTPDGWERA